MSDLSYVTFDGWGVGMKKVSCSQALQSELRLRLKAAKSITDRILDGTRFTIGAVERQRAVGLVAKLVRLGVQASASTP